MDIMIPLGKGSIWQNNELRYCLRSVERFLTGYNRVIIVGELPEWLVNVVNIPATDLDGYGNRDLNIKNKIIKCLQESWVTDDIYFMNDDHYLLEPADVLLTKHLYEGTLQQEIACHKQFSPYKRTLQNTVELLQGKKILDKSWTCLHYDIHCPIVYNRDWFLQLFHSFKWPNTNGACIKSIYANTVSTGIPKMEFPDLKFREPAMKESIQMALAGRPWFSVSDRSLRKGDMKQVLQELYPNKSKFER